MVIWVLCLIDVVCADTYAVRHLPKVAWVFVVLLLPLVGSLLWIGIGRPEGARFGGASTRGPAPTTAFPEYERPGRQLATNSAADEEFLRRCRERAEAQRRTYREQQRRADDA
nr:PLDc N-terminal domain-containing protein [Rhodococcus sp. HNM0569]